MWQTGLRTSTHRVPSDITSQVSWIRSCCGARRPEDGTLIHFTCGLGRQDSRGISQSDRTTEHPGTVGKPLLKTFGCPSTPEDRFLLHKILGMLSEMEGYGLDDLFGEVLAIPSEMVSKMRFEINKKSCCSPWKMERLNTDCSTIDSGGSFRASLPNATKSSTSTTHCCNSVDAPSASCGHYGFRYWTLHLQNLIEAFRMFCKSRNSNTKTRCGHQVAQCRFHSREIRRLSR